MKYQLSADEVKEGMANLSDAYLRHNIDKLEAIIELSEKLKVSMKGRKVNQLAIEICNDLTELKDYLNNYPIEEERSSEVTAWG